MLWFYNKSVPKRWILKSHIESVHENDDAIIKVFQMYCDLCLKDKNSLWIGILNDTYENNLFLLPVICLRRSLLSSEI